MEHQEQWGVSADAQRQRSGKAAVLPVFSVRPDSSKTRAEKEIRLTCFSRIMSKASSPFRAAWAAYNRSLQTQPLLTKAATSVTGFIVGDTVAQAAVNGNFRDQDWVRTARFATYGALVHGPSCHYFYRWLDSAVVGTGARQVLTKVAADQLLFTPFGISAFYATLTALEGRASETPQVLREKFVKTILAGYCVWPAVHVVNFRFVPGELRVLFVNCVQVLWNIVLCQIAASPKSPPALEAKSRSLLIEEQIMATSE